MNEDVHSDLETIAPVPPDSPGPGPYPPAAPGRGPVGSIVAALVVVSLVVGFGVATLVLNARDSGSSDATATVPGSLAPGTVPNTVAPGTTPGPTSPAAPADPDAAALGRVILRQSDVPAADTVALLDHGADLTVATLDLCNGRFASETQRSARRQVELISGQSVVMSTEAVLYRSPSGGTQAFAELRSVASHCPGTPVTSPVGEDTATTKFRAAPDRTWARTASVERLAYDFDTVPAASGVPTHSVAVYLRRGRALMGLYFNQPDGPQAPVEGTATVAAIVAVFEGRLAALPASVVDR